MHPMGFYERAIPCGTAESSQDSRWIVVQPGDTIDHITISCTEPLAIRSVLGNNLKIQFAEVEETYKTFAAESLVANPGTRNRNGRPTARVCKETCRCLSSHDVEAHAIGSQPANLEGMAAANESTIGVTAVWHVRIAVRGAQKGDR